MSMILPPLLRMHFDGIFDRFYRIYIYIFYIIRLQNHGIYLRDIFRIYS